MVFDTHFEWKHVHSLHSLGAKNRPMSITFILTRPGRLRAEMPPGIISPYSSTCIDNLSVINSVIAALCKHCTLFGGGGIQHYEC